MKPNEARCVAWDYEETTEPHYHIYCVCGPLDGVLDAIGIHLPQSEENDRDVQQIVDAFNRLAARMEAGGETT